MSVEMGSDPFEGLAAGAGMDPETVRSLAANGNLELAVRRYQRLKASSGPRGKSADRQAGSVPRGRLSPWLAQVELLRKRWVTY